MHQCLLFSLAACCIIYSHAASNSLNVLPPLNAPSPPICPFGCCVASCCATTLAAISFCCQSLTAALRRSHHQLLLALCCSCCWLVVAFLLSAAATHLCHCKPLCDHQRSCCRPLSPPIVDSCSHMVSSPATTHLCCSHCWLVFILLSAACFCHCLIVVNCQHHQTALPIATVPASSHHCCLNLIVASTSPSHLVVFLCQRHSPSPLPLNIIEC